MLLRLSLLFLFAVRLLSAEVPQAFLFQEKHMGCLFSLKLVAEARETVAPAAAAAFASIAALDAQLSDYLPQSEISLWEQNLTPQKPQTVSPDVWACLLCSRDVWKASGGVFDVTLGHQNGLWREMRKTHQCPSAAVLQAARTKSGFQHLALDEESRQLSTDLVGIRFDFGGIAKGQALDKAGQVLREQFHLPDYLLDAGGQIAAHGNAPGKKDWTVAIESLLEEPQAAVLRLHDCQLATSGDLHQFVEIAGQRYSHITDPATGLGVTKRRQASVRAANGMIADALATVCCILPANEALNVVAKFPGAEARILEIAENQELLEKKSPGW